VKEVEKFVRQDKVHVVAGFMWSNVLMAAQKPIVESKTGLLITNAGASPMAGELCSPYVVSTSFNNEQFTEGLGKFITEQGIALEYSQDIAPARGTSAGGKITLLPGQPPAEEFATLVHELAHEMMHRDEHRNGTSKRVRETEAEAVSFVVCNAIGLETGTAAQDYIQLYEGDAKLLTESLDRIQQTANRILTTIGPEQPAPLA
jgi:hypothetical protein